MSRVNSIPSYYRKDEEESEDEKREEGEEEENTDDICAKLTNEGENCGRVDRASFGSGKTVKCQKWCAAYYLSKPPTIMQFGSSSRSLHSYGGWMDLADKQKIFESIEWDKILPVERFEISPFILDSRIKDQTGKLVWNPVKKLYISEEKPIALTAHQVADLPYWFQGRVYPPKTYQFPGGVFQYVRFPEFKNGSWAGPTEEWIVIDPYHTHVHAHIVPI